MNCDLMTFDDPLRDGSSLCAVAPSPQKKMGSRARLSVRLANDSIFPAADY